MILSCARVHGFNFYQMEISTKRENCYLEDTSRGRKNTLPGTDYAAGLRGGSWKEVFPCRRPPTPSYVRHDPRRSRAEGARIRVCRTKPMSDTDYHRAPRSARLHFDLNRICETRFSTAHFSRAHVLTGAILTHCTHMPGVVNLRRRSAMYLRRYCPRS